MNFNKAKIKKQKAKRMNQKFHCFSFSFTFSLGLAMYTDKTARVKEKALTTKKFQRIIITVSNQRPNTVVIMIIFVISMLRLAYESVVQGIAAFVKYPKPLKSSWLLRIITWILIDGPKKFWKFPTAIQMGRSVSTLIQVIFYPKVK